MNADEWDIDASARPEVVRHVRSDEEDRLAVALREILELFVDRWPGGQAEQSDHQTFAVLAARSAYRSWANKVERGVARSDQ